MIKIIKHSKTFTNTKTHNSTEIEQFLDEVRRVDSTIGSYEQHLILTDGFTYSVALANGTISIYKDELQDKKALPLERFRDIAARFRERKTSLI